MKRMTTVGPLLGAFCLAWAMQVASGQVLYRETFPNSPNDDPPGRGDNVLDQGWDIIKNRTDRLEDILEGTDPGGGRVRQNSGAIFGNTDTVPNGDDVGSSGGVNNSPFLPVDTTDGILFASAGFFPFLFFTEEVPGATQASDVNYIRWRGRHNDPRTADPTDQKIHGALKVDGQWWVHEIGLRDPDSSVMTIGQIDISGGNWAPLDVTQLDFNAATIDKAELSGPFDQAKPNGTVEAWGAYNLLLTNNTRFDYIEFGSDIVQTFIPEPTSVTLALAGLVGMAAAGRRRRKLSSESC